MKRFATFFILVALFFAGCQPIEDTAFQAAATAQGFITQAQANHGEECRADRTRPVCVKINEAVDAQNLLVDAIEAYCNFPVRPTPEELKNYSSSTCAKNAGARERLQLAIRNMQVVIRDVKEAIQ
jgi:hypothetical protein